MIALSPDVGRHLDPDGKDTVTVFCGNDGCPWGTTFQYAPDDESISEFAVAVATAAPELLAQHASKAHPQETPPWDESSWGGLPWSTDEQRDRYLVALLSLPAQASIGDVLAAFNTVPYEDSYDREMFFGAAAHRHQLDYGDIFDAWLEGV